MSIHPFSENRRDAHLFRMWQTREGRFRFAQLNDSVFQVPPQKTFAGSMSLVCVRNDIPFDKQIASACLTSSPGSTWTSRYGGGSPEDPIFVTPVHGYHLKCGVPAISSLSIFQKGSIKIFL